MQAFVQPVQITEDGKMVLVGLPKDLLDYPTRGEPGHGYAGAMGHEAPLAGR